MKYLHFYLMIAILLSLLALSCQKKDSLLERNNTSQKKIKQHPEPRFDYICEKLYISLFIYYIDNKRFPTKKEGIVFGLTKTGKNPPYFQVNQKHFSYGIIQRKNGKKVKNLSEIQKGDSLVLPEGLAITYTYLPQKNEFRILGHGDSTFTQDSFYSIGLLKFKYLPRLQYTKQKNFKCGADYVKNFPQEVPNFFISKR